MDRVEFPPSQYDYLAEGKFNIREYKSNEVFAELVCKVCNAKHKFYAVRTGNQFPWHSYHYPNGLVELF